MLHPSKRGLMELIQVWKLRGIPQIYLGECQGVLRDTGRQPPEQLTELREITDAPGRKHSVFTGALMESPGR